MKATVENTIFLTIDAFENYLEKTEVFRKSAKDCQVPIIHCEEGEEWRGFYFHKIENMSLRLEKLKCQGYEYAFILDSRDVIFIDHIDTILEKFNDMNQGRVIFNHDVPGKVWPSHHEFLAVEMQNAMNSEHVRLNAGMLVGKIERILTIHHHVKTLREEFLAGNPRRGVASRVYDDLRISHINDDQHFLQICLTYYPELFQIDGRKQLFALLKNYPEDIHDYSDDPRCHDVINSAAIIHSPWLSRGEKWKDWALQKRWERRK